MNAHYDHIVIGVGSMGSATCYYLAKRGCSVLGLEQFSTPHENGSHAGESRIIRKAYYEHPDYIPLLIRAYENWQEISERAGKALYHRTGLFYAGPAHHPLLENIRRASSEYHIDLDERSSSAFNIPPGYETLFEPDAGYVEPENTIRAYVQHARQSGATILENTTVLNWRLDNDRVLVETNSGTFSCSKLVITAGAWSGKMIAGIDKHLNVTRQVLLWVKASDPSRFTGEHFPCWMMMEPGKDGVFYGFPVHPDHPGAIKLAYHHPAEKTDPDHVNRQVTPEDVQHLSDFLKTYLPSVSGGGQITIDQTKVCLYSNSPDEHFVIDNLPGMEEHVCVAWGFSGHGFKFVPVVGEIMADLAMYNKSSLPVGFLNASRFK
jgi:sarcosine oxidase